MKSDVIKTVKMVGVMNILGHRLPHVTGSSKILVGLSVDWIS